MKQNSSPFTYAVRGLLSVFVYYHFCFFKKVEFQSPRFDISEIIILYALFCLSLFDASII